MQWCTDDGEPKMPSVTTNDGVKLAYEQSGTSGPAVVLVHGWGASRECEWHAHTTAPPLYTFYTTCQLNVVS